MRIIMLYLKYIKFSQLAVKEMPKIIGNIILLNKWKPYFSFYMFIESINPPVRELGMYTSHKKGQLCWHVFHFNDLDPQR